MADAVNDFLRKVLEELIAGNDLAETAAGELLECLASGDAPAPTAGAILTALRIKGETGDELRGFANAMRRLARKPNLLPYPRAVDIVGTGGDGSGSLNISTGAALVAAAAGVVVVKHGNRSITSKSGSADVLEALGLPMPLDEETAARSLEKTGFTFLFAPFYHPAMKAIAPVRKALGVRTIFNMLGPLTNPAAPPFMLIGAFSPAAAKLLATALSGMEIERAFVIHGEPGWDEATPVGPFLLYDVRPGQVEKEIRDPMDYRLRRCSVEALAGGDAEHNAARLEAVLRGKEGGPHHDALVLGAALALELTGQAKSRRASLAHAREALAAGRGRALLDNIAALRK